MASYRSRFSFAFRLPVSSARRMLAPVREEDGGWTMDGGGDADPSSIFRLPSSRRSRYATRALATAPLLPLAPNSAFNVRKCCSARISVGAIITAWRPFSIAATRADAAITVLPLPTSRRTAPSMCGSAAQRGSRSAPSSPPGGRFRSRRRGQTPRSRSCRCRRRPEQRLQCAEVLLSEDLGRRHHHRLAAVFDRGDEGRRRDHGLAAADVALN